MLKETKSKGFITICADIENLPLKQESISCIGIFSVLHHCVNLEKIFKECFRVLKKGGLLYCDHDIDKDFVRRFSIPLDIYRCIRAFFKKSYIKDKSLTSLERLVEFREKGLDKKELINLLKEAGFRNIKIINHYKGLSPLLEKCKIFEIFNIMPLIRILAEK